MVVDQCKQGLYSLNRHCLTCCLTVFCEGGGRLQSLTGPPQHLALCVQAGTHSSVAEGGFVLAGFSVLQEDVGGAVRGGAGAELGEVAFSERLATHRTRRSQLRRREESTQTRSDGS